MDSICMKPLPFLFFFFFFERQKQFAQLTVPLPSVFFKYLGVEHRQIVLITSHVRKAILFVVLKYHFYLKNSETVSFCIIASKYGY